MGFRQHKTLRATGRPRVIYLTPAMLALTRELLARVRSGPLFLTRSRCVEQGRGRATDGRPAKKIPQLKGVVAYSFRHAFCTDGLTRGVPVATMAELLGHYVDSDDRYDVMGIWRQERAPSGGGR